MDNEIKHRKLRHLFGWHLVNGIPFPMVWKEDDGMVVGGIPDVVGDVMEITEEEFENALLDDLAKQHPFPKELEVKAETPSEEPKSV